MSVISVDPVRELDSRTTSYGLSVALLWNEETGETMIEMETDGDWSRFTVPAEIAGEAFRHPFVYRTQYDRAMVAV